VQQRHIAIADQDLDFSNGLVCALATAGHTARAIGNGPTAAEKIQLLGQAGMPLDLVIVDISMPDLLGLELIEELHRSGCRVPIVLVSGDWDLETVQSMLRGLPPPYLHKPFDAHRLLNMVTTCLRPTEIQLNTAAAAS